MAVSEAETTAQSERPAHSGRLLVRMPASLHDELANAAEREGVSLNALVTGALAGAVGWRDPSGELREFRAESPAERPQWLRRVLVANVIVVGLAARRRDRIADRRLVRRLLSSPAAPLRPGRHALGCRGVDVIDELVANNERFAASLPEQAPRRAPEPAAGDRHLHGLAPRRLRRARPATTARRTCCATPAA